MKPLISEQIRCNWATLLCAWNNDESLDLQRVAVEIDILIAMGVDGIYSNGTARGLDGPVFHGQAGYGADVFTPSYRRHLP